VRTAALARYRSLPDDVRATLLKTFLDPQSKTYAVGDGKASEYEIAIGRYQKSNGEVYFLDSGVSGTEHNVNDMTAMISMGSIEAKRSLTWILDFHSHSDDRSPGLSMEDGGAYNRGYSFIIGGQMKSYPLEFSGAFYGKQQVFYGWTRSENFTLTFDEIRNALSN